MRMIILIVLFQLLHCTSTKNYFQNRKNDFLDIFNLTVEHKIYGVGLYGLPFLSGILNADEAEGFGLRYGTFGGYYSGGRDYKLRIYSSSKDLKDFKETDKCFEEKNCAYKWWVYEELNYDGFGNEFLFFGESHFHEPKNFTNRNKNKIFLQYIAPVPTKQTRKRLGEKNTISYPFEPRQYTLFPFEISIGMYYGVRFGFTISEFFDFFLGVVGIDFMEDDVGEEIPDPRNYVKEKFEKLPKQLY